LNVTPGGNLGFRYSPRDLKNLIKGEFEFLIPWSDLRL
jgi:hypothetical protein